MLEHFFNNILAYLGIATLLITALVGLTTAIIGIRSGREKHNVNIEVMNACRDIIKQQSKDFIEIKNDINNQLLQLVVALQTLTINTGKLDNTIDQLVRQSANDHAAIREEYLDIFKQLISLQHGTLNHG